jgi:tetratricopeptide (TPR) repeat protein
MRRRARVAALACFSTLAAGPATAKELRVAADGSGDYATLLPALEAAAPDDVIVVVAGGRIGAALAKDGDTTLIKQTFPDSPAAAAGLKADDKILTVDGAKTTGLSINEVAARMRGPADTRVVLGVEGPDGTTREVAVKRAPKRYVIHDAADKLRTAIEEQDAAAYMKLGLPLAQGGLVLAQEYVAGGYYTGQGVQKDFKEALRWTEKAGNGGVPNAMYRAGLIYFNGEGTQADKVLAARWFQRAAEKNHGQSMFFLGFMNETGQGVPKSLPLALDWYRRAQKGTPPVSNPADLANHLERLMKALNITAPAPPAPTAAPVAAAAPAPAPKPAPVRPDVEDLPAARAVDPKAVALVIGVERYREALPRADYAASDAKLAAEYFQRVLGVSPENLALLTDEHATKSDFEKYIERWLPNHTEPGAKVFVYFSGHGAPEPTGGDAYLVPFDADPTYIQQTGYPLERLYAVLGKLPASSVVVAMDSCFSGAGGRSVVAKGARPLVAVKLSAAPDKLTIITASAGDQISNSDAENRHGLFTYYLLKGLKEKGPDFRAAFDYLKPEVARTARRRYNADQTPQWRQGP